MPIFNYSAINQVGRTTRGVVVADNELDLEERLKQLGLDLVKRPRGESQEKLALRPR